MPEDKTEDLVEVWVKEPNGSRHRVFRGRKPEHVAWKMHHHKAKNPELVVIEAGRHDNGPQELLA